MLTLVKCRQPFKVSLIRRLMPAVRLKLFLTMCINVIPLRRSFTALLTILTPVQLLRSLDLFPSLLPLSLLRSKLSILRQVKTQPRNPRLPVLIYLTYICTGDTKSIFQQLRKEKKHYA